MRQTRLQIQGEYRPHRDLLRRRCLRWLHSPPPGGIWRQFEQETLAWPQSVLGPIRHGHAFNANVVSTDPNTDPTVIIPDWFNAKGPKP